MFMNYVVVSKKFLYTLILLICAVAAVALFRLQDAIITDNFFAAVHHTSIDSGDRKNIIQLLDNRQLSRGLLVKDPELLREEPGGTHTINGVVCPIYNERWTKRTHELNFKNQEDDKPARWTLAQWGSLANLYPRHGVEINFGTYGWENWYKKVIIGKYGFGHRFVTLGVNGSREYKGEWDEYSDVCYERIHPSLIVEQTLNIARAPSVGEMDKLHFTMTAKLIKSFITQERAAAWDQNEYTAHFVTHLNFQNLRDDKDRAQGHGQSFGIGINFYDARTDDKYYEKRIFIHKPRQRLILYLPTHELAPGLREDLRNGEYSGFRNADILPYVEEAFALAIKEGKENDSVDELISTNLDDYYLRDVHYGWEVSSLHDVEMQVTKFSLLAVPN